MVTLEKNLIFLTNNENTLSVPKIRKQLFTFVWGKFSFTGDNRQTESEGLN